jgi:hypothetical protein
MERGRIRQCRHVGMSALPALLVVRPDDHDGLTRRRQAGAWLTMDPQAIAACFAK